MLKLVNAAEKTNSYRPSPWAWSETPFPAFRGNGARYTAFLAVAKDYRQEQECSKLIVTKEKGTLLLVPCEKEQDEKILLVTALSGFRGGFSRIKAVNAEILLQKGGNIHCVGTEHLVVRLQENGYLFTETGRRCFTGDVEIFMWDKTLRMPTEEFEIWAENYGV